MSIIIVHLNANTFYPVKTQLIFCHLEKITQIYFIFLPDINQFRYIKILISAFLHNYVAFNYIEKLHGCSLNNSLNQFLITF